MKLSKRQLRLLIKEEKARILNEEFGGAPCPHATAAELMNSGLSAGELLGWVKDLVNDLTQAEVSVPMAQSMPLPNDATFSMPVESTRQRKHPTIPRGCMPGFGFANAKVR